MIHRCNSFRERKSWWPIYIWIVRKRADQAFKAYKLTLWKEVQAIEGEIARLAAARPTPASAARAAKLKAERKTLKRSEVSHFDFLEEICGYHIMKVRGEAAM